MMSIFAASVRQSISYALVQSAYLDCAKTYPLFVTVGAGMIPKNFIPVAIILHP
jgi:hypothetical protein